MNNYWLFKSEPTAYSIDQIITDQETIWDGVRNYQARNFLRSMKKGDYGFFYHSNCKTPAIVGLVKICEENIIDPSQFDIKSPYFDPQSTVEKPRWYTVKVKFEKKFTNALTLSQLKEMFLSEDFLLVKKGNRLSIMPVQNILAKKIMQIVN
ncbi:MAG: EVE domain-containing protein [Cyanobacterium sp. T60_A2020_053]|nr:EVE domain-containing protein [Cyanobacterium sp. T60_A2020_053]